MKRLLLAAFLLTTSGCNAIKYVAKKNTFHADCNMSCFAECNEKVPDITEDPDTARKSLELSETYRAQCKARKQACVECLNRSKADGAIDFDHD